MSIIFNENIKLDILQHENKRNLILKPIGLGSAASLVQKSQEGL